MRNLAENLLGGTRTAILSALLLNPEQLLHVREIARITGTSPGTLHRELKALASLGLLNRNQSGRQVYYSANRDCPVHEELAGLLRKTAGLVDVLRSALEPVAKRVRVALVYGSMARGTEQPGSDVDVLLVGHAGFVAVVRALRAAELTLRREVNPSVMNPAEFARKARAGERFIVNILHGPKLWILGTANDLAELGENRSSA